MSPLFKICPFSNSLLLLLSADVRISWWLQTLQAFGTGDKHLEDNTLPFFFPRLVDIPQTQHIIKDEESSWMMSHQRVGLLFHFISQLLTFLTTSGCRTELWSYTAVCLHHTIRWCKAYTEGVNVWRFNILQKVAPDPLLAFLLRANLVGFTFDLCSPSDTAGFSMLTAFRGLYLTFDL